MAFLYAIAYYIIQIKSARNLKNLAVLINRKARTVSSLPIGVPGQVAR